MAISERDEAGNWREIPSEQVRLCEHVTATIYAPWVNHFAVECTTCGFIEYNRPAHA